jgi:hypothetical protein
MRETIANGTRAIVVEVLLGRASSCTRTEGVRKKGWWPGVVSPEGLESTARPSYGLLSTDTGDRRSEERGGEVSVSVSVGAGTRWAEGGGRREEGGGRRRTAREGGGERKSRAQTASERSRGWPTNYPRAPEEQKTRQDETPSGLAHSLAINLRQDGRGSRWSRKRRLDGKSETQDEVRSVGGRMDGEMAVSRDGRRF